jgi:hypothetical protein
MNHDNFRSELSFAASYVAGYLSGWMTATDNAVPPTRRTDLQALIDRLEAALKSRVEKEPVDG